MHTFCNDILAFTEVHTFNIAANHYVVHAFTRKSKASEILALPSRLSMYLIT